MDLISPTDVTIVDGDGKERTYVLSKFPAVQGREIATKYPTANLPKLGDYQVSEETMFKLMAFVGVHNNDQVLRLTTRALIDNHVPDWETLARIEMAMMEYNCSFFRNGTLSLFFGDVVQKVLQKISEMSTPSSAPSSTPARPASTNSGPSTA